MDVAVIQSLLCKKTVVVERPAKYFDAIKIPAQTGQELLLIAPTTSHSQGEWAKGKVTRLRAGFSLRDR